MKLNINKLHRIIFLITFLCSSICTYSQLTAWQAIDSMGVGINMGNTLDAPNEGDWSEPAKQYYFEDYKNAGFQTVRIPVTWQNHFININNPPYTIDSDWMERVEEVIDWALAEDLWVIMNIHHENLFHNNYSQYEAAYLSVWDQIIARFSSKSKKLVFEIINEPQAISETNVNSFNVQVYNKIRAVSSDRIVVFGGDQWSNSKDLIDNDLIIPDPSDQYLIGYYHSYDPWDWGVTGDGLWGGTQDKQDRTDQFQDVVDWSTTHNIPVCLGEFGAKVEWDENSVYRYHAHIIDQCKERGIAGMVWDVGNDKYNVYTRNTRTFNELKDILIHYTPESVEDFEITTSTGQVDLSWSNRATNAEEIILQRRTESDGYGNYTTIATMDPNSTQYTDYGLSTDDYLYRVITFTTSGNALYGYPQIISVTAGGSSCSPPDLGPDQSIDGLASIQLNTTLSASGRTFIWVKDGAQIAGATQPDYTVTESGTYMVTVDNGGCIRTDAIEITGTPDNDCVYPDLGDDKSLCGLSNITLQSGLSSNGKTFTWKDGAGNIISNSTSVTISTADTYTLDVDSNGCVASDAIVITNFIPTFSLGSDVNLCTSNMIELGVGNTDPQVAISWTKDGAAYSTNDTIDIFEAGVYEATKSATGCSDVSDDIIVTSDLVDVTGDTVCSSGQTAYLSINDPGNFEWFDAETDGNSLSTSLTYTPTVTASTTYYIEDANGATFNFGKTAQDGDVWANPTTAHYSNWGRSMEFDVQTNLTIESFDIFINTTSADVIINIYDATNSYVLNYTGLSNGQNTLPVNLFLTTGIYTVDLVGSDPGVDLQATNNSDNTLTGYLSFSVPDANAQWDLYGYFYNWEISVGNTCARTPVHAIIDANHSSCGGTTDCNGDANGSASIDVCGICSGGNTGITPGSSCSADTLVMRSEYEATGDLIVNLDFIDEGSGTYTITGGNNNNYYSINGSTGEIRINNTIADVMGVVHYDSLDVQLNSDIKTIVIVDAYDYFIETNPHFIVLDQHQQTDSIQGNPYTAYNNLWGKGSADENIDFRMATLFHPDFEDSTVFIWDTPSKANVYGGGSVWSYVNLIYGNRKGQREDLSGFPFRIGDLTQLDYEFDFEKLFGTETYKIALNHFMTDESGIEPFSANDGDFFMVFDQIGTWVPPYPVDLGDTVIDGKSFARLYNTDGDYEWRRVIIRNNEQLLSGNLSILDLYNQFISRGYIDPNQYVPNIQVGIEVTEGWGAIRFNKSQFTLSTNTSPDCNGDPGGSASVDACGTCSGGNTGITPNSTCTDCNGDVNGTASVDACGTCSGGNTGITPNSTCTDCNGDLNGTASVDACGTCSGGNTGITPNSTCTDCNGDLNGTASVDACGTCSGGNTGITPNSTCTDCNGDLNGTASVDACGTCSGGNTGITPNSTCTDCNGDVNGTASVDACGTCSGGNTGITPNSTCTDCNGDLNGTASIDACGTCSGGNTGITPNSTCTDCNGDLNGTASVDACGTCSGGNTGITPNSTCTDCNGDLNGTASIDACGTCSGGNTGITPNSTCTDCNGDLNGTASVDACGTCSGGNTGITPVTDVNNCVTAIDDGDILEITLYPNPTTGITYLSEITDWVLFDATGKKLMVGKSHSIDLSNYKSGMYLLKINNHMIKLNKE